jgi:hypothetical protein
MLGRRRHSRFQLAVPADGSLRVREDVLVETWNGREAVVLSSGPARTEERFRLELPERPGDEVTVRVLDSRPEMSDDGPIRYRLRLGIVNDGCATDE